METKTVRDLREEFGIMDESNEYTVEELLEISNKEIYYITIDRDRLIDNIYTKYRRVPGYVSSGDRATIFIKDEDITEHDNKYCYPVKMLRDCCEIRKGIYHDKVDGIMFCTTDEIDFCLDYFKEYIKKSTQLEIARWTEIIEELECLSIDTID